MIVDYTVIGAIDTGSLTDGVFELIEQGWVPIGGVAMAFERNIHRKIGPNDINLPNDFQHYAQAMVKCR